MEFIKEKDRIYALGAQGRLIAEITFPTCGGVSVIDHTFVDDSLRGQGIAGKLMQQAVDNITAAGDRIAATCPYAVAWLQRHPQYKVVDIGEAPACRISPPPRK